VVTTLARRVLFSLAGGTVAAAIVGAVEAGAARDAAGAHAPAFRDVLLADVGVLAPVAALVAFGVAAAAIFLEPDRARSLAEHAAAIRAQPVLQRSRNAALAVLVTLGALVWCVAMAYVAKGMLAQGAPLASGLKLATVGVGLAVSELALILALTRPVRRALAAGAERAAWLVDPVATGLAASLVAAGVIAYGVSAGDTGGDGGALAIFGVLKRSELDLRPVADLAAIALGAYLAPVAFAARAAWGRGSRRARRAPSATTARRRSPWSATPRSERSPSMRSARRPTAITTAHRPGSAAGTATTVTRAGPRRPRTSRTTASTRTARGRTSTSRP
jgi:hypothetical protein